MGMFGGWKESIRVKHLKQYLAHNMHHVSVSAYYSFHSFLIFSCECEAALFSFI